jgi:nuclear transcription Y subunit beta
LTSGGVTAVIHPIMSPASSSQSPETPRASKAGKHHESNSDANIRNFAPVARIMKTALPENAKIAKEAKECMQECVSEFISFITSEGSLRYEIQDKLFAMLIVLS